MSNADRLVIRVTVAACLVLPWPVAVLTHDYLAASATCLGPALIGGAILKRRGWRSPL
jgi:hypothetical protein